MVICQAEIFSFFFSVKEYVSGGIVLSALISSKKGLVKADVISCDVIHEYGRFFIAYKLSKLSTTTTNAYQIGNINRKLK